MARRFYWIGVLGLCLALPACTTGDPTSASGQSVETTCEGEECAEPAEPDPGEVTCKTLTGCGETVETTIVEVIPVPNGSEGPSPAPEVLCDGIDQDGDGIDQCDRDGDGVSAAKDCDDANPTLSPHAIEIRCDGKDQNCDGFDDCDSDGDGVLDRIDCDPDDPEIRLECHQSDSGPVSTE